MLKALLRRLGRGFEEAVPRGQPPGPVATPAGIRLYAVGDVHGHARMLDAVIDFIVADAAAHADERAIAVMLGDYVDRGPDSRGVLERLSRLPAEGGAERVEWVFLSGNHESTMLAFLEQPHDHAAWLGFGGTETLASYGVIAPPPPLSAQRVQECRDALAAALPPHHLAFLKGLRPIFICGDYAFVHAGVRPGIALERQHPEDLRWIRDEFLRAPHWHGKCVVHGHTIEAEPALLPWRIGIDTGAYAGGDLCCLVLAGTERCALFPAREPRRPSR